MNFDAIDWSRNQYITNGKEKLLLVNLCIYADESCQCWPSKKSLAKDCSTTERHIRKLMGSLASKGLVSVARRRKDTRNDTNMYQLNLDIQILAPAKKHQKPLLKIVQSHPITPSLPVHTDPVLPVHTDRMEATGPHGPKLPVHTDTQIVSKQESVKIKEKNTQKESPEIPCKTKPRTGKSIPPTLEEVQTHLLSRSSPIDAEQFFHFYESKGWKVGKGKMKNWHSAVITWEKRNHDKQDHRNSRAAINEEIMRSAKESAARLGELGFRQHERDISQPLDQQFLIPRTTQ